MNRFAAILMIIGFLAGCKEAEKAPLVKIRTKYGVIRMVLHDETPKHKANFLKLVSEGRFDSLLFHRTIQGFMIQGGDPDSKYAKAGQALGDGDVGYTIPAEFSENLYHRRGAVGAAREDNPEKRSSGIQFYIVQGRKVTADEVHTDMRKLRSTITELSKQMEYDTLQKNLSAYRKTHTYPEYRKRLIQLKPAIEQASGLSFTQKVRQDIIDTYLAEGGTPHLDQDYTVFGQVISGMDVIDAIAALPADSLDRPVSDVRFFAEIEYLPKSEIEQEFGYHFPEK